MRLQAGVVGGMVEHLIQDLVGRLEPAYFGERLAKPDRQVEPDGVARREQLGGPGEDVDSGRHIAAEEGTVTGASKSLHRSSGKAMGTLVGQPQLGPVAIGLLEVMGDDLLILLGSLS